MKKSDIYEIAIKILGLYLVVIIIGQFKEVISYATILIQAKKDPTTFGGFDQTPLFMEAICCLLVFIAFSGLLIFRTRQIAKLICKKGDYEETSKLFTDKKTIYEIALILVGLLTIIQTLPEFAFKLRSYILMMQNDYSIKDNDKNFLIIAGLKISVGILAIVYTRSISSYLTKEKNKTKKLDE